LEVSIYDPEIKKFLKKNILKDNFNHGL
jgi:hypothetical protein